MSTALTGNAGRYNRRLTLTTPSTTSDALAGSATTYINPLVCFGQLLPQSFIERLVGAQQHELPVARYRIRKPPSGGIVPGMRLLDGSQLYQIQQVNDVAGQYRELELTCQAVRS
jgi:head-tail adaptor